jgi:hypothetical protein
MCFMSARARLAHDKAAPAFFPPDQKNPDVNTAAF